MLKKSRVKILFVLCCLVMIMPLLVGCQSGVPSGTYSRSFLSLETTVKFEGSTATWNIPILGQIIYKYALSEDGTKIIFTDASTNKTREMTYKYVNDPATVVLDGISYYKK